jgi:hypothetical protein
MLTAGGGVKDSGVYVAVERATGTLQGARARSRCTIAAS